MKESKYKKQRDLFEKKVLGQLSELGTNYYSPSSVRAFINYLSDFLFYLREISLPEQRVRRTDMHGFISRCKSSGESPKLINRKVAAVRKYYSYLQKRGRVEKNPADGLYLRTRRHKIPTGMLTDHELQQLYDSYQVTDLRTARNKVILSLLTCQAVTTDDIQRLEPADIHLREGRIRIPGTRHEGSRTLKLCIYQLKTVPYFS